MSLPDGVQTLMLQCVPRSYTPAAVHAEIAVLCDFQQCDWLHLPWDSGRNSNIGYVFINFSSSEEAQRCAHAMLGHIWARNRNKKTCRIVAARVQGLQANLAIYVRSSAQVMLDSPTAPLVFSRGQRVPLKDAVLMHCDTSVCLEFVQKCERGVIREGSAPDKKVVASTEVHKNQCAFEGEEFVKDVPSCATNAGVSSDSLATTSADAFSKELVLPSSWPVSTAGQLEDGVSHSFAGHPEVLHIFCQSL